MKGTSPAIAQAWREDLRHNGVDILGADTRLPSDMMGGNINQSIYNSRALKVQEYLIRRGMPSTAIRILGRGMNTGQSGSQIYLRFRF